MTAKKNLKRTKEKTMGGLVLVRNYTVPRPTTAHGIVGYDIIPRLRQVLRLT